MFEYASNFALSLSRALPRVSHLIYLLKHVRPVTVVRTADYFDSHMALRVPLLELFSIVCAPQSFDIYTYIVLNFAAGSARAIALLRHI